MALKLENKFYLCKNGFELPAELHNRRFFFLNQANKRSTDVIF